MELASVRVRSTAWLRAARSRLTATGRDLGALGALGTGAGVLAVVVWSMAGGGIPGDGSPPGGPSAVGARDGVVETPIESPGGDPLERLAGSELVVHVAGRVREPGLVRLAPGSRVADALDAAGGPHDDAALDAVNLARPVADGEQLWVPGLVDVTEGSPAGPGAGDAASGGGTGGGARRPDGTLDLNRATAAELQELPGIGPVMSERIIDHREAVGGFSSLGELREVPGIGEKTFQSLSEHLGV